MRDEIVPGAEWVAAGEGVATRKWDGTCCMVRNHTLFKRFDAKAGKTPPPGFEPAQDADPVTGHWPGWVPVGMGPNDARHREAWDATAPNQGESGLPDGTYELIGPKVQKNPEAVASHLLVRHGNVVLDDAPRDFDGLRAHFAVNDIEGIVWHHSDGRMVKIKAKDFGLVRASREVGK